VKLSIVLTAYSMLPLSLRATKGGKGFIWARRGSFKAGRRREVWKVLGRVDKSGN
jgi:hypothetical protein